MKKGNLKSRKRREQTIAIIIVAAVVLIATAAILIFIAAGNDNLGEHDHDHANAILLEVSLDAEVGDVHYTSVEAFKEAVESQSHGEILVSIKKSSEYQGDAAILSAMSQKKDTADIVITSVSNMTALDERMDISALPFAFSSFDEAWSFMEGVEQKEIESALIQKNIRVLAHYSDGFDHMLSNSPISNPEDMVGLSIAAVDEKFTSAMIKSFRATPVLTVEKGLYQTLLGKSANAYMGDLQTAFDYKLYAEQQYMALTYHRYEALAFAISEETWKSMSEEQQKIVQNAALSSANRDR